MNHWMDRFFTRIHHPQVKRTDPLTISWPKGLLYVLPLVPVLPKLIKKKKRRRRGKTGSGHPSSSLWPHHPWFPALLLIAADPQTPSICGYATAETIHTWNDWIWLCSNWTGYFLWLGYSTEVSFLASKRQLSNKNWRTFIWRYRRKSQYL